MQLPENIIDMHCHTAGIGAGDSGCFISRSLQKSWKFGIYLKSFGVTPGQLKRQGDGLVMQRIADHISGSRCVSGAVVLAMDGAVGEDGRLDREQTELYVPNAFVSAHVKKHDTLHYGCSINPYRSDALERLQGAIDDGAVLLKWLPSIMHIDPADERLTPFYKELARLKLPLLCHTGGERSFTRARDELCDPRRLELPLSLGVTVIAAHLATNGTTGGEDNMDRLLGMFPHYSNLYADISGLTQADKTRYVTRTLKHSGIHERLLYGTDFPLIATALYLPLFHFFRIGLQAVKLHGIQNPWDRDVMLKQALGIPGHVFSRAGHMLGICSG